MQNHGLNVRYTPEDATRTDFNYLVEICNAAIDAGADRISAEHCWLCNPYFL